MGGIVAKLKQWWEGADRTQRLVTLLGGGFLVVLLVGTFMFASKPKMSLLFAGLSQAEAGNVVMELESMGVPVQLEGGGNVLVPADKIVRLRADLARANKLPKSSHVGYAELDKIGIMKTQGVEREQLRAILEGELAQSIEFFDGVDSARVHVSPGSDSPFVSEKREPQASVTISTTANGNVTSEQGRAMANLIASAVPGLDAKKVSIFDREGRAIYDGSLMVEGAGMATTKLEMQRKLALEKRTELQQALDRVFGPDSTLAMISDVRLNTDQVSFEEKESNPSNKPLNETKVEETMTGSGTGPASGDVFGANTGAPGDTTKSTTTTDGYKMTQVGKTRLENVKISRVTKGVGEIAGMSITVFANSEKIEDQAAIGQTVAAYLGPHAADTANYTAQVVWSKFDDSRQVEAKAAAAESKSAATLQQILAILPMAALAIIAIVVMRQIGKFSKTMRPLAMTTGGMALPMPDSGSFGTQALATGNPMTEVVRQKALEAGISEEVINAAIEGAGEAGLTIEDIPTIESKINVPLEQIRKMGEDRPEVVAMLIKSWLLEERR